MDKPPFPEVVDNTFREAFTTCHQKFYWNALRRQVKSVPNIHLHAGGAFAKAMEITRKAYYVEGKGDTDAVAAGHAGLIETYGSFDTDHGYEDHAKSLPNMLRAFEDYWFEYGLAQEDLVPITTQDGSRGIEFSFAIPTEIPHPVTGNPILYAGRFDMLAQRGLAADSPIWVEDEKTSGQLGQSWNKQWDLNSQFTGYCFAAKYYGYPVVGAVIRGVGLLKTKISHQQVILYRPDWMINRWWGQLHRDLRMMVALWEVDPGDGSQFDFALGAACSAYGECSYKTLCMSPTPEDWVKVGFETTDWSPLAVHGSD